MKTRKLVWACLLLFALSMASCSAYKCNWKTGLLKGMGAGAVEKTDYPDNDKQAY